MCGISGILQLSDSQIYKDQIKAITAPIAHRGPDGEGHWINEKANVGFGHRRLSILDISEKGKQPMSYADGRFHITYNGEVFNFLELREELNKYGYQFVSDTDTEVILAAYHKWGKGCLHKLNGMWAFAIWDEQEQELFLARDRFGIKPLYYLYEPGKKLVFGSETIQFKYIENFQRTIDPNNLQLALKNPWCLEGYGLTIYKGIQQILPGHFAILKNGEFKHYRWWSTLDNLPEIPSGYKEQVEQFRDLFFDACKLRLRSDVSIASALSGGLDSSSVYSSLHHIMKSNSKIYRVPSDWQKAYVASFSNTIQDETNYARSVISHLEGRGVFIEPNYSNLIQEIVKTTLQFDAVYATPLNVIEQVYRAMRMDGTVVSMDGHGVDEMMFGYAGSYQLSAIKQANETGDETYVKDLIETYIALFPVKEQALKRQQLNENLSQSSIDFIKKSLKTYVKYVGRIISSKRKNAAWFSYEAALPEWTTFYDQHSFDNPAEKILYDSFHHTTLPTILRNFDRASMMSGVEIRMPFMDYRLVSFVFALPIKSKLGHGYTKRILRDAMKGILPEDIRTRKLKTGFAAPMNEWFTGVMADFIRDEVSSKSFIQSPYWNGTAIKDHAIKTIEKKAWNNGNTTPFWNVFNAHILMTK